jgi:hypothetical protein
VKIQIMGGKVGLKCNCKTLLGVVNKTFLHKKVVDNVHQYLAKKIKTKNVHNSLKVMESNPGYLLESSLYFNATVLTTIFYE